MLHRILHERVEEERRHLAAQRGGLDLHSRVETLLEAHLLDRQVAAHRRHLLLEQRHVQRALHQRVAKVAGECGHHLAGALAVLVDQRADGVERVEEEVRVELVREHPELRVARGGHGAQCLLPLLAQRGVVLQPQAHEAPPEQREDAVDQRAVEDPLVPEGERRRGADDQRVDDAGAEVPVVIVGDDPQHPCHVRRRDADGERAAERRRPHAEPVVHAAEQQRQQEADQDVHRLGREDDLPRHHVEPPDHHRDAEQQPAAHVEQQVAAAAAAPRTVRGDLLGVRRTGAKGGQRRHRLPHRQRPEHRLQAGICRPKLNDDAQFAYHLDGYARRVLQRLSYFRRSTVEHNDGPGRHIPHVAS